MSENTLPAEVASLTPAEEITTIADLEVARGECLTAIDDIINTAREADRDLTPEERAHHDAYVARHDTIDGRLADARAHDEDVQRFAAHDQRRRRNVPMINRTDKPAHADRNLDELLWATDEIVRAGTAGKTFRPSPHGAVNPVEQVVVRNADDNVVHAPRITAFLPEHREAVREFQRCVTDMSLAGMLLDKSARTSAQGFEVARNHRAFKDRWDHVLRAMDVDTAAEGGTWVPTGIGADLHEKVRASGKIAPLFTRINLPTNPWKWPIEGADAVAYRVAEPTTDTADKVTASTPGTVAATFDAEIFGARALWSRSSDADSIIAIMPYVRAKIVQAFVDAEEKAILDGDTDGTHQDTDVQALGATDVRSAWDGLRKKGLAQTADDTNGALTVAEMAILRATMGKWGVNPADLVFIVGVSSYHDILADDAVETVEKYGPQATILNGQIGSVFGIPIIASEHVREDLNASGVDDGITATKTYFLCVNRNEWALGQRMALDVETDESLYRESFQRVMVAFQRADFQHIGDAATNDDTAIGYNVTP